MSHCRWVVVAEECFDQLRQLSDKVCETDKGVEEVGKEAEREAEKEVEKEVPIEEPAAEQVAEKPESQAEKVDWTKDLPHSFQKVGAKLLESLQVQGLTVADSGVISIDDKPVEGYSIETFLRTTCVPFHQGNFPMPLSNWLRSKGIVKFRNQLATIRPAWKKRYSLRKSTTGAQ